MIEPWIQHLIVCGNETDTFDAFSSLYAFNVRPYEKGVHKGLPMEIRDRQITLVWDHWWGIIRGEERLFCRFHRGEYIYFNFHRENRISNLVIVICSWGVEFQSKKNKNNIPMICHVVKFVIF